MKKVWVGFGILTVLAAAALAALWLLARLLLPRGRGSEFYLPRVGKDFYLPRVDRQFYVPRVRKDFYRAGVEKDFDVRNGRRVESR